MEKVINISVKSKQAKEEIEKIDKTIVQLEDNVADANRELIKMEAELSKTGGSGKALARRKQLNDRIAKTKVLIKQENLAIKNNKRQKAIATKQDRKLTQQLKAQAKAHNDVNKGLTKSIGGTAVLDRATGGLFSKVTGLTGGLRSATQGMKLFKVALIGTGVGAFVVALGSLITYFKSSEEGQNRLTKAMKIAGSVMANITETVSILGEGIFNVGKTIVDLFGSGTFEDVGNAIGDTYEKVTEKTSTLVDDIKEDAKVAMDLSDQLAKADKIDRALMVDRAKANEKVALLRTKAYDLEKYNSEERIGFLQEAMRIEDEVTDREIEAARIRFNVKKEENEMTTLATKEDLDEQAKLEAKLNDLEYKKLNRVREVANQRQTILNQERRKKEAEDKKAQDKENERLEEIQDIRDEYAQLELEKVATTELAKVELEEANKLAELERLNASEEDKKQVRDYYLSLKDEARIQDGQKEIEANKAVEEAKAQIQRQGIDNIAAGFALLGQLAGKNKKLQAVALIGQSAAGIAKSVIETQAANITATAQGASLAIPTAGASVAAAAGIVTANNIAAGIGIASNIAATVKGLKALGEGGAPSGGNVKGGRGSSGSKPPAFNVVGSSDTNQLAQAIGTSETEPVKAYVVSNEITNAQSLERNIIEGATIG
jgi:hypothetical protein